MMDEIWEIKLSKSGGGGGEALLVWYCVNCLLIPANHPFKSAPTQLPDSRRHDICHKHRIHKCKIISQA